MPQLPLESYRTLIHLDEPFVPVRAAGDVDALAYLQEEALKPSTETDPRRRLRALLTLRPATPFPAGVHAALDALWQAEARARPVVDVLALPTLPGRPRVSLWQGDITTLRADAIVNAANAQLLGCFRPFHACIDNAIHAAAGPRLREDCGRIMSAQGEPEATGAAKATRAYHLPSRFVLHTVGPIVKGPLQPLHEAQLASAYRACLDLAVQLGTVRTLVFCGISSGLFGFPRAPAAAIAVQTVDAWLQEHPRALDRVVLDVFADADRAAYVEALDGPH